MRSRLASSRKAEAREELASFSVEERLRLASEPADELLAQFAAERGLALEAAPNLFERQKQLARRRPSACQLALLDS